MNFHFITALILYSDKNMDKSIYLSIAFIRLAYSQINYRDFQLVYKILVLIFYAGKCSIFFAKQCEINIQDKRFTASIVLTKSFS